VKVSGDLAYTYGVYRSKMMGEDGKPVEEPGKFVTVWHREPDRKWRIVLDTYNTDIMPPVHANGS
jgi:ketosteroid isomerase-like protein